MKLTNKQIFIIKSTLGIMFAYQAGGHIGYDINSIDSTFPSFINSFFVMICVLIIQWVLFSKHLPKKWLSSGVWGVVFSAFLVGILLPISLVQLPDPRYYSFDLVRHLLMGLVVAIPQGILLKENGGSWVLFNVIGWGMHYIFTDLLIHLTIGIMSFSVFMLINASSGFWLGVILSLSLYKLVGIKYETQ